MKKIWKNVIRPFLKRGFLLMVILFLSVSAYGQSKAVSGTVTDQNGQPLPGAQILVKGTQRGATTDFDGKYTIDVQNRETLVFSFIGFKTVELAVGSKSVLNVQLEEDTQQLNEVVVIGYGEVRRKDLTGALGSMEVDEVVKAPVASLEEAMAGRISGLQVTSSQGRPGASSSIVIRGAGSLTQSSAPLYVVDGFPLEDFDISSLDQSDIASIEVLKGPSAVAIYGARGGNGVILITSKDGSRGKAELSYNAFYGYNQITQYMDVLSSYDFVDLQYEINPDNAIERYGPLSNYLNPDGTSIGGVDWQKEVFGNDTEVQSHSISVNGGNKDTKYNLSLSDYSLEGLLPNSGFDRTYVKLKIDQKLSKKLRAGANFSYSVSEVTGTHTSTNILEPEADGGGSSSGRFNLLKDIVQGRPTGGLFYSNEELLFFADDPETAAGEPITNPLVNAHTQLRGDKKENLYLNGYLQYEIANNLDLKVRGGISKQYRKLSSFDDVNSAFHRRSGFTRGSIENRVRTNTLISTTLNYKRKFDKHNVGALFGFDYQDIKEEGVTAYGSDFPDPNLGLDNLGQGTAPTFSDSYRDATNLLTSYFSRFTYDYAGKYLFTTTLRYDGSSRFGSSNKWGYFPSLSGAWRFSDENFLKDSKILNDGKLRFEWGQSGNNRIPANRSTSILNPTSYGEANGLTPGVYPSNLPNPDIKWETQEQINIGLDLAFFDNRISLTADVYRKESKELLLNAPTPGSSGFESVFRNIGKLRNEGLELSLSTENFKGKFSWNSNLNLTFPSNKTIALVEDNIMFHSSEWYADNAYVNDYITQVGQPFGLMYGYIDDGLYREEDFDTNGDPFITVAFGDEELGYRKYVDVNEDGTIDENDKVVLGNPRPKFFGGFSNNFKYKGFDLNVFFQWSYGNDLYNANRLLYTSYLYKVRNFIPEILGRWRTDRTPEENAGATFRSIDDATNVLTSAYIEDGSFIRLKTVSLGYTFPKLFVNKLGLQNFRVYVTGQNLVTWTDYSGFDPEVSTRGSGLTAGVDFGAYPRSKTFIGGISVSF
ncbi:SusC/RagA family TonB-linked outer membrane protein [Aestuariivivens insulae]|uniref:SusC/RagA family TonB-linked outer membrane protein n=1 Tax=Aestuariivivens insulae TaxID=1621988 RepID=UPI001F57EA9B|nr:TonB-dependent receptor [Aestuariivivens insulae]